jgi:hypothetical protein
MWRLMSLVLAICLSLSACAPSGGKELPMITASDPTWPLVPDHLQFGALPQ